MFVFVFMLNKDLKEMFSFYCCNIKFAYFTVYQNLLKVLIFIYSKHCRRIKKISSIVKFLILIYNFI